jgi:hypothetical protein
MYRFAFGCALAAAMLAAPVSVAGQARVATAIPTRVGTCAFTRITGVHQRLVGENNREIPDSGSAVELANGVYGVSYDQVPAVQASRRGDRVITCLVSIPRGCPPGDNRGRLYTTTNLRTEDSWTLPDSQHRCGGA